MPLQNDYNEGQAIATRGMKATMIPATILSRTVETVAGIGFGVAVEQGADDKGIIIYDGGTNFVGITLWDRAVVGTLAEPDKYARYESARVMVKGDIWVPAAALVTAGQPVYVRPSNGDFQPTNANSAVLLPNARWDTSTTTIGQLAVVRLG